MLGLFGSLIILILLPFIHVNAMKGNSFYPASKVLFWLFVISFAILTLAGAWPVEDPYVLVRQGFSFFYFFYFLVITPLRHMWDILLT